MLGSQKVRVSGGFLTRDLKSAAPSSQCPWGTLVVTSKVSLPPSLILIRLESLLSGPPLCTFPPPLLLLRNSAGSVVCVCAGLGWEALPRLAQSFPSSPISACSRRPLASGCTCIFLLPPPWAGVLLLATVPFQAEVTLPCSVVTPLGHRSHPAPFPWSQPCCGPSM